MKTEDSTHVPRVACFRSTEAALNSPGALSSWRRWLTPVLEENDIATDAGSWAHEPFVFPAILHGMETNNELRTFMLNGLKASIDGQRAELVCLLEHTHCLERWQRWQYEHGRQPTEYEEAQDILRVLNGLTERIMTWRRAFVKPDDPMARQRMIVVRAVADVEPSNDSRLRTVHRFHGLHEFASARIGNNTYSNIITVH